MNFFGIEDGALRVGRCYFEFRQQWSEWLFGKYNWRNFTAIEISYEDDSMMGGLEFIFALLGFRIRVYWVVNPQAETRVEIMRRMDEIMADPSSAIPIDDFLERRAEQKNANRGE